MTPAPVPLRLLYIDNDPLAQGAITALLGDVDGIEIFAASAQKQGVFDACAQHEPHLALIDLYLDPRGLDGIQLAGALMAEHPTVGVVICTSSESPVDAARAWDANIQAYVTKRRLLAEAARLPALLAGILDGNLVYQVDPRHGVEAASMPLSDREIEVLQRKAEGQTHRQIADELCLSVRTIDSHLANIRTKLRADSIVDALRIATERGLVPSN